MASLSPQPDVNPSRGEGPGVERSASTVSRSGVEIVTLAVGLSLVYFLAARRSFLLRAQPGVAVFWPAAGIAAGVLIALGPKARLPMRSEMDRSAQRDRL